MALTRTQFGWICIDQPIVVGKNVRGKKPISYGVKRVHHLLEWRGADVDGDGACMPNCKAWYGMRYCRNTEKYKDFDIKGTGDAMMIKVRIRTTA